MLTIQPPFVMHCQEIPIQLPMDNRRHKPPGCPVENKYCIELSVYKTNKRTLPRHILHAGPIPNGNVHNKT